jgi:hypothetical protein
MRNADGWLDISIQAIRIRTLEVHLQLVSASPKRGRAAKGTGALLRARHDYGTRVLMRTRNLAAVMRTMGYRDARAAMHYQHPELEVVRAALDYGASIESNETSVSAG